MKISLILAILTCGVAIGRGKEKALTLAQARANYAAADAKLNKAYASAMGEMDKTNGTKLREDERGWVQYRDEMVQADFNPDNGAPEKNPDYWTEIAEFEQDRTDFLRAYSGKHVPPGISGEYSDSYGGALELKETEKGVDFDVSAVRGPGHNQGEITGTITFKGDAAYFKEVLDAGEAGPPCELIFKQRDGHIVEIEEKVADSNAGAGVHYDGNYYKIGKVKKTEK